MNTQRRRSVLVGLALGVLLALLIAPQTRWLVQAQFAASGLTFQSPETRQRRALEAEQRIVVANPNDFAIQLADVSHLSREQFVPYLRTLVPRFGNQPSLYAALLRYEMGAASNGTGVYLSRKEEWQASSQSLPQGVKIARPPNPALLAAFDRDAAVGERLDPDNAYFPLMRAIGLFAAHRDTEGLDAVRRAGTKSVWREYTPDEINARLRLAEAASGHTTAIRNSEIIAAELFPQYLGLRSAMRVAIVLAANKEQAGQTEQGLAIRHAVLHTGGLMRAQSTFLIGSLVGIAIAAIATARPGGANTPGESSSSETMTGDERAHLQLQGFAIYTERIGHPEAAREAFAEAAAGQAAHTIERKAQSRSVFDFSQFVRLGDWWATGLLTLINAFWFLLVGVAAAGLARIPTIRRRQPLSRPAFWGMATAVLSGIYLIFHEFADPESQLTFAFVGTLWLAALLVILVVWILLGTPEERNDRLRIEGQFGRTYLLATLALSFFILLSGMLARNESGPGNMFQLIQIIGPDSNGSPDMSQSRVGEAIAAAMGLFLPLLMLLVLSIAGCVRRVPVSVTVVEGFRRASLPATCILIVLYGGLILGTARQERQMDDGLHQMVQHEGRYLAGLVGQAWPGVTP